MYYYINMCIHLSFEVINMNIFKILFSVGPAPLAANYIMNLL